MQLQIDSGADLVPIAERSVVSSGESLNHQSTYDDLSCMIVMSLHDAGEAKPLETADEAQQQLAAFQRPSRRIATGRDIAAFIIFIVCRFVLAAGHPTAAGARGFLSIKKLIRRVLY